MTIEQAIKRTEKAISIYEGSLLVNRYEGLKAEIEYYSLVKDALNKQVPKKVNTNKGYFCPSCQNEIGYMGFCDRCGQKLEWS